MAEYSAFKKSDSWRCHKLLLFDWITVVVSLALWLGLEFKEPFNRMFSLSDLGIQHPYAEKERVPVWALGVSLFHCF